MEPVDIEVTDEDKENFKRVRRNTIILSKTKMSTCIYQDMKELFSRMDKDKSGTLDRPEVILFMKALSDDLSDTHISMIFDTLDTDGSNTVDIEEFMVETKLLHNLGKNVFPGFIRSNISRRMEA